MENYRIRKVVIFYFLEDKSIMITEPKQVNSGTPQGAFLKRQMALKQDGSQCPFMPSDFCIGLDIGIYGRQFRIYDCDSFTREFFQVSFLSLISEQRQSIKYLRFCLFLRDSLGSVGPARYFLSVKKA